MKGDSTRNRFGVSSSSTDDASAFPVIICVETEKKARFANRRSAIEPACELVVKNSYARRNPTQAKAFNEYPVGFTS